MNPLHEVHLKCAEICSQGSKYLEANSHCEYVPLIYKKENLLSKADYYSKAALKISANMKLVG